MTHGSPRKWSGAVLLPGRDASVLVFGGENDDDCGAGEYARLWVV